MGQLVQLGIASRAWSVFYRNSRSDLDPHPSVLAKKYHSETPGGIFILGDNSLLFQKY
jgi:hypothetical protein